MTKVSLRAATAADTLQVLRLVRGLAEYEQKLADCIATEADIHALLFGSPPRAYAVLAEFAGRPPVGLALFYYTITSFAGRAGLFLEDLFVEPAYRGTGIGLALLQHLARRAVAENCNSIEWRVLDWNQSAIEFYQRLGATTLQGWHTRELRDAALVALAEGARNG